MDDPVKVLNQLRHYVSDGRLEIAEVMAEELTNLLLSEKNRTIDRQELLVLALRDHANILEIRLKWKSSIKVANRLSKEKKSLISLRAKNKIVQTQEDLVLNLQDHMQKGRVFLQMGKMGKAITCFSYPAKTGYIEAFLLSIEAHVQCKGSLKKATKLAKSLNNTLGECGPLSRENNEFYLYSQFDQKTSYEKVSTFIQKWLQPSLNLNTQVAANLAQKLESFNSQKEAIERGEQAANARLQSAIDSLQPAIDYHEYSQSSR
tara:strand:- start:271 stop:1056 length:786 start_codon:yes stop_codon:yes gene_type:complete